MARTIQQISFPTPMRPSLKRVAAYARVSSGKDAMLHSLSAQVSYYSSIAVYWYRRSSGSAMQRRGTTFTSTWIRCPG